MSLINPSLNTLHLGPELVAIVPAHRLSWHRVTLPAGALGRGAARGRLRAVLEGLLEEQLLDEPASLHFALAPHATAGQPVWVAVCDRAWIRSELQSLERAGQSPHRVVPAWAPVESGTTPTLWIGGTDDAPQALWCDTQGVHLRPVSSDTPVSRVVPPELAEQIQIRAEPGVAGWAERWLGQPVLVETPVERLREAARSEWDLAQLDLVRRSPLWQRLAVAGHVLWNAPAWKPARWAALALVLAQITGLNIWAWRASAQEQAQREAVRATLQATFPAVTVIVDPVLQMRRQVAGLQQQSGQLGPTDFENQLAAIGSESVTGPMPVAPAAIEYAAGESRLKSAGVGPERLDGMNQSLQRYGLQARLEGADLLLSTRSTP